MASPETFDIPIGKVVGPKGDTGNGIASIELLSTSGLNKTYRITMTDETTFDFVVTDGNGITGASFDAQTNALTLTFQNGTTFTTPSLKGTKGDTGTGISKIEKTGTDGLVDTYTVTYTDGQTYTYTVTNGADGVSPEVTVTPISGGHTVEIEDADGVKTFNVLDGEVTEARMAEALATKAPVILETASGAIASFDDGADSMPIRKLVATIEPVQAAGTPSPETPLPISGWTGAVIGNSVPAPPTTNIFSFNPKREGTGNPSPTNIRRISGYTITLDNGSEVTVYKGTIRFNPNGSATVTSEWLLYTETGSGGWTKNGSNLEWRFLPSEMKGYSNGNSIMSHYYYKTGTTNFTYSFSDTIYLRDNRFSTIDEWKAYLAQLYNDGTPLQICAPRKSTVTYRISNVNQLYPIIKENGYDVTTLPINWEPEAGTIYGGTVTLNEDGSVDVVSTNIIYDLSTDFTYYPEAYQTDAAIRFGRGNTNLSVTPIGNVKSNVLVTTTVASLGGRPTYSYYYKSSNYYPAELKLPAEYNTNAKVKAFLQDVDGNGTHAMLLVNRATPITYHFSDVGHLYTYLGANNVWIDTGAITECDYPADTKMYIDGKIAEMQATILENIGG